MRTFQAEVASAHAYQLAEGPVWDEAAGRVLWVDIPAGCVVEGTLRAGGVEATCAHMLGGVVGAAVPAGDGGLLVAVKDAFATISPDGVVVAGPRVLPEGADSRFNDGACDPAGRFLVGSMALDDRERAEHLYRLEPDRSVTVVADGITLSNGLAWSPDGATMYHVDSVPGVLWAQPYDPATGDGGPRRELLRLGGGLLPDGLCVDVDGNLWLAVWGGAEVRCYTPAAEHIATVRVPAPHTSSVAFVGPGRDRLLITTAREDLSDAQLAEFPDSGRLFLADVGTSGVPTAAWAGTTTQPAW